MGLGKWKSAMILAMVGMGMMFWLPTYAECMPQEDEPENNSAVVDQSKSAPTTQPTIATHATDKTEVAQQG